MPEEHATSEALPLRALHDAPRTDREDRSTLEHRVAHARPRLLRLAQLQGVSPDAMEDIVQETLLEAWYHLPYLREPDRLDAWLDGICRNMCRRWQRASRFALLRHEQFALSGDADAERHLEDIADPLALDPEEELSRQDWVVLLDRALGHLSSVERSVVELSYLAELSQQEAARQLGITVGALEQRLYRARQQLRLILNGPLRADAEELGLVLDPQRAFGWRESREWCMFCGRQRLRGIFEPLPDGRMTMRLRCPDCSRGQSRDLINSNAWIPLEGVRSFRPAIKRLVQKVLPYYAQAATQGWQHCGQCGAVVSVRILSPEECSEELPHVQPWPGLMLVLACPSCGDLSSTCVGTIVCSGHAAARDFMEQHPRWINEPERLVAYEGQPAIRVQLTDISSAAQLTLFVHRHTWRVLAAIQT